MLRICSTHGVTFVHVIVNKVNCQCQRVPMRGVVVRKLKIITKLLKAQSKSEWFRNLFSLPVIYKTKHVTQWNPGSRTFFDNYQSYLCGRYVAMAEPGDDDVMFVFDKPIDPRTEGKLSADLLHPVSSNNRQMT